MLPKENTHRSRLLIGTFAISLRIVSCSFSEMGSASLRTCSIFLNLPIFVMSAMLRASSSSAVRRIRALTERLFINSPRMLLIDATCFSPIPSMFCSFQFSAL